ncbi:hypothetical protein [Streptomyces sp. NPDC051567]|uniref:hypothetical protein n=1 Tax=Streptomyces sp. NPDC051567 TaxID=3365660 RepID=UPI0037AB4BA9
MLTRARVREGAGRAATITGAAVLTLALDTDLAAGPGILAAAATAGTGLAFNPRIRYAPQAVRATAIAVYTAPHTGCALLLAGGFFAPDSSLSVLVQIAVAAAWTGATWWLRPGLTARALADEALAQELAVAADETAEEAPVVVYATAQAQWWGEHVAVEDGVAAGTVLLDHRQVSDECLALVIGAAEHGRAVPKIAVADLSALLDIPEDLITIGPVPGRGAGVRLVVLGRRPEAVGLDGATEAEVWADIAATAMPGVELVDATTYTMRKELI